MIPHRRLRPTLVLGGLLFATLAFGCDETQFNGAPGLQLVYGSTGLGPREFSYPRAAAIGPGQRLYVVDKAARVQCFSPTGEYLAGWRMPEWNAGKPTGLGVGPDGRVYVADTHYSRVMIFSPDGEPLGQFGTHGEGPGEFLLPTDVAVAVDGSLYVSEYGGNDRISKFTADFRYLFSFGNTGAGALQRPQSLVLAGDGTLWVADACNHRICHFGADGDFLGAFGSSGTGTGEMRFPYGLDFLPDGTLAVCEYGNNRVQRFDTSGQSLGRWGAAGRAPGQLAYPWTVAVEPDGRMVVLDSGNNRVQVVDPGAAGVWRQ
jgi:DNA-binding beta-propeller fold protein YncE